MCIPDLIVNLSDNFCIYNYFSITKNVSKENITYDIEAFLSIMEVLI